MTTERAMARSSPMRLPVPGGGAVRWLYHFARRKPLGFTGLAILVIVGLMSAFASVIAPYSYKAVDFTHLLAGPSREHILGTDNLGRDLFTRILYGSQVSLGISFAAVAVAKAAATVIAVVSGYYGGWLDKVIQRIVDAWLGLPNLIIVITLIGVVGPGVVGMTIIVAIATTPFSSRVIRSVVLQVREEDYVEAARSVGATDRRIMLRYIFPNVVHMLIYTATVSLGAVILLVASLGFLGYGVPPPRPDLGAMLSGAGLTYMRRQPLLALWPGLVITGIVFSFNVFGDALRDALDPKLRGT